MKRRAVRAATAIAVVSAVTAGCSLSDGEGGTQQTPTVTLAAHDSFLAPQEVLDAFQQQSGIKVPRQAGRRRGADQQARADQGQPDRRRRLRRRLHLRLARAARGRLRALHQPGGRPRAAALRRRPRAPAVRGRRRRRLRQRRHELLHGQGDPGAGRPTRTCRPEVQGPAGRRGPGDGVARPGVPPRHHRASTARPAGRSTGRS